MKIGLIGSGGREVAIARALLRGEPGAPLSVWAGHANPGLTALTGHITVGSAGDARAMASFFQQAGADLVVVGPEAPLMAGVVDLLRAVGIAAIGPTRYQAQLEGSKAFMRDLLQSRVPGASPQWALAADLPSAETFLRRVGQAAIKPVGLTGGKGVKVMGVHLDGLAAALEEVRQELDRSGQVLLEERLIGQEFSRIALVADGKIYGMPVAQDFKYARDGDTGGMTGGMGAYTCADGSLPFLQPADLRAADQILADVVAALEEESGTAYRGFLYGQFMATAEGVRVIEFNVRLGDPEGINEMLLLESNAPALLAEVASGRLPAPVFQPCATVVKYLVPQEYPEKSPVGISFRFDQTAVEAAGFTLLPASVEKDGDVWRTLGSRALALYGSGPDPASISARMEDFLARFEPPELRHRKDVGSAGVLADRTAQMERLRGGRSS